MHSKQARPDYPVQDLITDRWSPYGFSQRMPPVGELASVFEAARWAASSYNEQPWRYLVATRDDSVGYARLLSCLVEANQVWARAAPVLALGVVASYFQRNEEPNPSARHDLGAASASLTFEATARGLYVHQMAGIDPRRAREVFDIPNGFEPCTGLAIGYPATADEAPDRLLQRDTQPRSRRPQSVFVFGPTWGEPAHLADE